MKKLQIIILVLILVGTAGCGVKTKEKSNPTPPAEGKVNMATVNQTPTVEKSETKTCLKEGSNTGLTLDEAFALAEKSECKKIGEIVKATGYCKPRVGVWTFNLRSKECGGAYCIVDISQKTAKANLLCN